MVECRIVDMSNDKYIIKGISLGKGAKACYYMNANSNINSIIITDRDIEYINDGELIFSIKNIGLESLYKIICCFFEIVVKDGIKYDNVDVRCEEIISNSIGDILLDLGINKYKENMDEELNVSLDVLVEDDRDNNLNNIEDELCEKALILEETFTGNNIINKKNRTLKKGNIALILIVISIILIVCSIIMIINE